MSKLLYFPYQIRPSKTSIKMKVSLYICLVLFVTNSFAQTPPSKAVLAQIKQVENHLAEAIKIEGEKEYNIMDRMAYHKVKGLSIAVIQNYKILWAKGYGWADEEEKRAVTINTLFKPGSISKSLNALGVLKLVQDKKLDLYADINTYLRSWKFPYDSVSKGKKITTANLLSHTAGLTVHGFPGYNWKDKIPTVPQILNGELPANTAAVRSEFEPGLRFQYSGGGTTISQLIVSDITKLPYDKYIADAVFRPLGMNNSLFTQPPPVSRQRSLASGYYADGSKVDGKFHLYPEQGAAGLWTTPTDLCKYIIETQLAYDGKSSKVLNKEMTQLRLTPYIDQSSALGVFIEERGGIKYFQHGAANEGFRGIYYGSLTGGNGVAIFVNSDNGKIMNELLNSVATVYDWKGFYTPVLKREIAISDERLQKTVGTYLSPDGYANIIKDGNDYFLTSNGNRMKMHFSSDLDFYNKESIVDKKLIIDESGNVTGYARSRNGEAMPPMMKVMNTDTLRGNEMFFNSIGWDLLENKSFKEAITYLSRGNTLYPSNLLILGNLAHAYLFSNDYERAMAIYRQHANKNIEGNLSWEKMIVQDFDYFKKNGFDTKAMQRVLSELDLQK